MLGIRARLSGDFVWYFLRRHARGIALDVGAHYGEYLSALTKCEKVFAFEPNPYSFARLARETSLRIIPVQKAVSDHCGKATFFIDARERSRSVASTMSEDAARMNDGEFWPKIEVDCITLDSFCVGIDPSIIKIDVELHEPEVIAGAREVIARCKPAIVFEMGEGHRSLYEPALRFLVSLGYHLTEKRQSPGVLNVGAAPPR